MQRAQLQARAQRLSLPLHARRRQRISPFGLPLSATRQQRLRARTATSAGSDECVDLLLPRPLVCSLLHGGGRRRLDSTLRLDRRRDGRRRNGSGTATGGADQQRLALQRKPRSQIDHTNAAKDDNEGAEMQRRAHIALLAAAFARLRCRLPAAARSAASPHLNVRTATHYARKRLQCALLALHCLLPALRCLLFATSAAAPRSASSATALSQRRTACACKHRTAENSAQCRLAGDIPPRCSRTDVAALSAT